MNRILLGAEILPWKDPISGEVNEGSRILPLALPAVPRHLLIEELVDIIVRKFERLHPDKGKLEIKCLFNGYKEMLDMADFVGDIFVDRTPGGVDERGFTVLVQREPPKELSASDRYASVPPDSFARPPKRPSHGLLQRAAAGRYAQENAHERTEQMNKRRRLDTGAREGLLDPDCAVRSTERDLDLPTIGEPGANNSRQDAYTHIVEDSQRSPRRSQLNTYATPTFLSILGPNFTHFRQRIDLEIPNSLSSRAGSLVGGVHEAADATGEDTPKSESPEMDNVINDVPPSNPSTPRALAPPQSKIQQKTSTRASLLFPKTETPTNCKQNGVLGATGLTTPRDTTPGGQSAASNTESRCGKLSYGRVSSDRSLGSKAFVSGRRTLNIYTVESDFESSQTAHLDRNGKRNKQHRSPAAHSLSRPKPFSHSNGSSAISSHFSTKISDGQCGSTSGQAISHQTGPIEPEREYPDLASITAPVFAKGILQRVVDRAEKETGRALPQVLDPQIPSVERRNGESNPGRHREDSADVEIDRQIQLKGLGKAKPSEQKSRLEDQRDLFRGTPSISASRAVLQLSHAQPLHQEPPNAPDMNMASDNREDTRSGDLSIDSLANTSVPSSYRTKVAKKTAPAEPSESENSENHDSESDGLSDQERISNSKDKKSTGKTTSRQLIDPEWKTTKSKGLHVEQKPKIPIKTTTQSSKAVKGEPITAAFKSVRNKLIVQKPQTSITSPIPGHGPAHVNRSDSLSLRRNVNSNALKRLSTASQSSPIPRLPSHRSVSFEDAAKTGSEDPRPLPASVVEKEEKAVALSGKQLAAKKRQQALEAKKRQKELEVKQRLKYLEEVRNETRAMRKLPTASPAQKSPEANKDKTTETSCELLVPLPPAIVEDRSKDKDTAITLGKATASATKVARSSTSPSKSEPAPLGAAVVPLSLGSPTTEKYPERFEVPQDDKDAVLVEENKDISYAFKRPESKSKSRSPARAVSSSVSSSSASDPGSESETESCSRVSGDSEGKDEPSLPVKHDMAGEPVVSIGGASDTASSNSDIETDDGNLPAVSLSRPGSLSPAPSRDQIHSESASARDSAERQVQREIRESIEPSRSSQARPPPKTSTKAEAFSSYVKSGPASLEKRGGFSVNARHPTFSQIKSKNNPKYKDPVMNTSSQPKPEAKVNGNKYVNAEAADDTDSTESEDEEDEETDDDEDVDNKKPDPRSSQSSKGKTARRGLMTLFRLSEAVIDRPH